MTGFEKMVDVPGEQTVLVPEVIPVFPLARTVLLPGELLPLHVFEPRYRAMVRDALSSQRVIGLVPFRAGGDEVGERTPLEDVGCLGFIAQHRELEDGRFVLWLVGVERFRIESEVDVETPYRQVRVAYMPTDENPMALAGIQPLRQELRAVLPTLAADDEPTRSAMTTQLEEVSDSQLLALGCQVLELDWSRKQQMLETAALVERFLMLYEDLYSRTSDLTLDELDPSQLN
jgi:Lon protease-like protein